MKYSIGFDEANEVVRITLMDSLEESEVEELMSDLAREFAPLSHRRVLVDLSKDASAMMKMSKSMREAYKKHADPAITSERTAIIGATPVNRMAAKIAVSVMGESDKVRFFKAEAQALAWLKGKDELQAVV